MAEKQQPREFGFSRGEIVCIAFMEHIRDTAASTGIDLGTKTNEVIAFGKIGVTCRSIRTYLSDPAVVNMFQYKIEIMFQEMY